MFYKYGTTLRGLMTEHGIAPDDFLDYVHDIDHSPVPPNQALDDALHALPGRKLIFTNGTVAHAEKVLARIGITHHFGDIFDIVHSDFIPKPEMEPYRKFVAPDRHPAGDLGHVRGHRPQPRSAARTRHDHGARRLRPEPRRRTSQCRQRRC